MQQPLPSAPPSQYNYHSAPEQPQSQYGYGGGYESRYGVGGRKRRDECCCGCTRKSCIIIAVVSTIVFVLVLIGVSVGIYYAVTGVGDAVLNSNKHDEDPRLSCQCNNRKPECKYNNRFAGTMICKPGEECWASTPDELFGKTFVECRKNPDKYICKRDENKKTMECWCEDTNECVSETLGCGLLCGNGTDVLKP